MVISLNTFFFYYLKVEATEVFQTTTSATKAVRKKSFASLCFRQSKNAVALKTLPLCLARKAEKGCQGLLDVCCAFR